LRNGCQRNPAAVFLYIIIIGSSIADSLKNEKTAIINAGYTFRKQNKRRF
jgi:hypothetical protein